MSVLNQKDIEEILDKKLSQLVAKLDKVDEVLSSISFLSKKYDELREKLSTLESTNKELVASNQILKNQVTFLSHQVADLLGKYDELEQYGRRECLEIKGVPVTKDEDTDSIIVNVGAKVGVTIYKSDISVSHRNPGPPNANKTTSSDPPIIVKFVSRNVRDSLYRSRFKLKDVSTKDLGYTRFLESRIFIEESLTKDRKAIHKACLRFKKDQKWSYCWTRYGKVFLREHDDSPAIHITSLDQLRSLI